MKSKRNNIDYFYMWIELIFQFLGMIFILLVSITFIYYGFLYVLCKYHEFYPEKMAEYYNGTLNPGSKGNLGPFIASKVECNAWRFLIFFIYIGISFVLLKEFLFKEFPKNIKKKFSEIKGN